MSKNYSNFKILFVYPNIQMRTTAPVGIGMISAILKEHGFQTDLFDVTRYEDVYTNPEEDYDSTHEKFIRMDIHKKFKKTKSDKATTDFAIPEDSHIQRVKNFEVLPFDWGEKNVVLKKTNMFDDFRKKVESYGPSLIAISLMENTFDLGLRLLNHIQSDIPIMAGGVFATYAPDIILQQEKIKFVCRGEGEHPTLDLCIALADGLSTDNILNIWTKDKSGEIIKNPLRPAVNINELPWTDFELFEEELLYTPMQGRVWKAIGFETQRGCPYTCTYCNSPSNNIIYSDENAGRFHRKKTVDNLKNEMEHIIKYYQPELMYMVADTFLAMSPRELDEFSEFYQSYKIPFWMNTRAETITEHSAKHLAKMNCLRFNIGIEHGNPKFRKEILKRSVSNQKTVDAFHIAAKYSDEYTCVANNIIGLPTESPELVFDTIELSRALPEQTITGGAYIFIPYHGTPLRQLAIEKNYIDPDLICTESSNTSGSSLLRMPQFSPEEIDSFMKVFSFFVKFPKERWSEVEIARKNDKEGNRVFEDLRKEYSETYVNPDSVTKQFNKGWTPKGVVAEQN